MTLMVHFLKRGILIERNYYHTSLVEGVCTIRGGTNLGGRSNRGSTVHQNTLNLLMCTSVNLILDYFPEYTVGNGPPKSHSNKSGFL